MGTSQEPHSVNCPPDVAFEEYAMNRLSPESREKVERHLKSCPDCAAKAQGIAEEIQAAAKTVRALRWEPEGPCPGDETLALYLDQSLSEQARDEVTGHLAECRNCQEKFAGMYRELKAVTGDEQPEDEALFLPETSGPAPATEERVIGQAYPERAGRNAARIGKPRGLQWRSHVAMAAAGAALLAAFLTGTGHVLHLQFLALASLGYAAHARLVVSRHAARERDAWRGHLLLVAALGTYVTAWFQIPNASWWLTASFALYLGWLFHRSNRLLSARSGEQESDGDASTQEAAQAQDEEARRAAGRRR